MSTSSLLGDYTAQLSSDPDRWLGLMVIYSVADTTVPHVALEQLLTSNGLGKYVPKAPADSDVFRRACTSAQKKRVDSGNGVYTNILVRDVSSDEEQILKRIVAETVDQAGRRLTYDPIYDLVFTKDGSHVAVRRIGNLTSSPAADEASMHVASEYRRLVGTVDGAAVRTVIGRALDGSKAVSLRPGGGCYFVAGAEASVVAGLEQFAGGIDGTMVHSVPLPNDEKQRSQVTASVEDEAKVDIERLIGEVAEALKSGEPLSGRATATLVGRHNHVAEKVERYSGLLNSQLSSVRGSLAVLDRQMKQLVTPAGLIRKAA